MKIGINAMQVRAAKSGVGQYIHALLEALLERDPFHQYTVFCTAENQANYAFPARNLETVTWGLPENRKFARLINEYRKFPDEIARHGLNVFHGPSNFLPLRKTCPYVVTIHDLTYFVQPGRTGFLRRHYWYEMTRRTVKLADAIITDSACSKNDIKRFFPGAELKTHVVPLAAHKRYRQVEYGRERSALQRLGITEPYVLFVGTLEPGKNVSRVIQAFDSVAEQFPHHVLLVAGDRGWMFEGIFQTAQAARHRDRIRFLGYVDDLAAVDLMNFCDALLFPSLYEGFGLPPLEGLACGAPVITSNTSSIPEVVGDAALMVDPYSIKDIATILTRVLTDGGLREELRRRGPERASLFSWDKTAEETLQVFKSTARACS